MYPGKFIVFEGLDGSGQSTQAAHLKEYLESQGRKVLLTKEPTKDTDAGKEIRRALDKTETRTPQDLQELFAKDREWHVNEVIIPALKKGEWVISDRYAFSSMAYGKADGADFDWIVKRNSEFLLPDLTFLLKVAPATSVDRIKRRGEPQTLFEYEERLAAVWKGYEKVASLFPHIHIINGEQFREEVAKDIREMLDSALKIL